MPIIGYTSLGCELNNYLILGNAGDAVQTYWSSFETIEQATQVAKAWLVCGWATRLIDMKTMQSGWAFDSPQIVARYGNLASVADTGVVKYCMKGEPVIPPWPMTQAQFNDWLVQLSTGTPTRQQTDDDKPSVSTMAFARSNDTLTQGNWKLKYGIDGFNLAGDSSSNNPLDSLYGHFNPPVGATILNWDLSNYQPQSLLRANMNSNSRLAAAWSSTTSFSLAVDIADSRQHHVALYFLDWDNKGRSVEVQIQDKNGSPIVTTPLSGFQNGVWLNYDVIGPFKVQVTNKSTTAGVDAVLSGIFLGA